MPNHGDDKMCDKNENKTIIPYHEPTIYVVSMLRT